MARLAEDDSFKERESASAALELDELVERWPDVLRSRRPSYIAAHARLIVEQLQDRQAGPLAVNVLWQALDAVGPGREAATQRAMLGNSLFDIAMRVHDLPLAFNVAARMILSDEPHESFWYQLHRVLGALPEGYHDRAVKAFDTLEHLYDSEERPPWNAVDGALGKPFSSGN